MQRQIAARGRNFRVECARSHVCEVEVGIGLVFNVYDERGWLFRMPKYREVKNGWYVVG